MTQEEEEEEEEEGENVEPITYGFAVGKNVSIPRLLHQLRLSSCSVTLDDRGNLVAGGGSEEQSGVTRCPAFYKVFCPSSSFYEQEELKPHPELCRLFAHQRFRTLTFDVGGLPMVCPPMPWTSPAHGGYLLQQSDLVRVPELGEIKQDPESVLPVLDSLNQLGSVPWVINKPVLDLAVRCFANQVEYSDYLNDLSIPIDPNLLEEPEAASAKVGEPTIKPYVDSCAKFDLKIVGLSQDGQRSEHGVQGGGQESRPLHAVQV